MGSQLETLADALETLATNQPAAPALHVPGRRSLTFEALATQIRYVRERLGGWGIAPGDTVAGVVPSRPEMAVACATLPSSSTFAPLAPTLTPDVYAQLIVRMRAKAVIAPKGRDHPIRVAARQHGIAEIDVISEPDAPAGLFTLECRQAGDSLRTTLPGRPELDYILASSGTTGRPKLVLSTHRKTLLYAKAAAEWLAYSPNDVSCHLMPIHLGNGFRSGLLNPLLGGLSIVCLPESDVDALFAAIEQFQPTCLNAGFILHRVILRRAPEYREALRQSRFRFLRAGTGQLRPEEIDRLEQAFGAPLLMAFSSTETGPISHDPLPPRRRKRGAVGLPLGNEVGVMDDAGRISATGTTGEIVVRGPLVFPGYLDDPELTAASFAGDWFRTGDLGRIDDEGYVYLTGRMKELINRGGEKIAPAEVDAAIESLQGVREAATFAVPHPSLGEEIVAAVVRHEDAAIDEAQVIEHVRRRMGPNKKGPRRIYFVDRIPRTGNGKVRRLELPHLLGLDQGGAAEGGASRGAVAPVPLSPLEGALAGLWASLLQVGHVGRADDFFLLGGDSLRGVQLIAHVKALFGVELTIQSLFDEAATVAGMARAIETIREAETTAHGDARGSAGRANDATIPRRQDHAPVLSHTQQRVWFLARLDPRNAAYNECRAYRLSGPIDIEALRASLRAVVERHEILRTTYTVIDDEPRPIVPEDWPLDLQCVDLSSAPAGGRDETLSSVLTVEAQAHFDLEHGPLARFRLLRIGDDEHVLLRVWHHIVADGWSAEIFERELSQAYSARVAGRPVELPALPLQYADYAWWQRQWLTGEALDRQLAFWKGQLAHLPTLELPTDRPRPAVRSYRGARVEMALPPALADALKALGRADGATPFMTLLAAFQVLLHRYSGAEDIAVGTPIAGRRRAELEGLIGFFANTLVLRVSLAGEPTFREVLRRVRECALAAYTHQDVPFEKLVEELAPQRDLSRNPLFQICFALQRVPGTTLALQGLQVSRLTLPTHSAKFDLTLTLRESERGLHASWEYCTDLFERATIERLAGHFQVLLESIVAQPAQRIGRLAVLSTAERHRLLVELNNTAAESPSAACVHALFEAQAAATPQALAVLHEGTRLTYAQLNARANHLAHYLRALGVGPQAVVAICMERSPALLVGLLGILKAGAAYVPLDPDLPRDRLAFMLQDTATQLIITQQTLLTRVPETTAPLLCLDREWSQINSQSAANPPPCTTPQHLAYLMYTSGSTGQPKAVAIRHEGIVRLVREPNYVSLSPADTIAQGSNVAFDAATFEIWGALLNGARLAIISRDTLLSARPLAQTLARYRVSCLFLPTALFNRISIEEPAAFRGLRYVLFGGETCDPARVGAVLDAGPPRHLVHVYGPTEATTFATFYEVRHVDRDRTIPIGRPISSTEVYVLDSRGDVVPVGVVGEIYIGGPGVATGYLGRPEETRARFVRHPLRSDSSERVFRTGDLARWRSDGNIEFVGRNDDQVKIAGFRIEPSEIGATLNNHPAVRVSHVMARPHATGNVGLTAYFVARDPDRDPPTATELRRFLSSRLPRYMVPRSFVSVPSIPLTPNGKVDHRALPDPSGRDVRVSHEYVAPRDATERTMCRVWAEMLGIDRVGLNDNFFEIGGHSLLAARLFARLDEEFGCSLPLGVLFAAPTVLALVDHYRGPQNSSGHAALVAFTTGGSLPPLYAIPGVFGNIVGLADLSRELGPDQPFYALQAVGLDGTRAPLRTIDAMARLYLSEIRTVQPHGPYALVGVCFGATVAYEMTSQLLAAGEEVAFLGLLDPTRREGTRTSENPISASRAFRRAMALGTLAAGRLRLYLDEMRRLRYRERIAFIAQKLRRLQGLIRGHDTVKGTQRELNQVEVYQANIHALDRYERRALTDRLKTLEIFEATRPGRSGKGKPVHWRELWDGNISRHLLPGRNSGDMLTGENVRFLATLLAERLRRAHGP